MKRAIVIIILLVLLITGMLTASYLRNRPPDNPDTLAGNTPGNLNNMGLFCENDGTVYFSNVYDNGIIYTMTPDGENISKIGEVPANYINADRKYLYYYQTNASQSAIFGFTGNMMGIYRCKKNGRDITNLKRTPSGIVNLAGNYLYYQNYKDEEGVRLYRLKTDKSEDIQLSEEALNPSSIQNGILYYNGLVSDLCLHAMDTATGSSSIVFDSKVWQPCVAGDYIYYMNVAEKYKLYRYTISSGENVMLTEDRLDTFNVGPSYIYYQKSSEDDPGLIMMDLDGSNKTMVAAGVFNNINLTSTHVYFMPYNETNVMYASRLGSSTYEEFAAAREAAMAQKK